MTIVHPVSKPYLTDRERDYVTDAVESGWISSQGPYVARFERAFADWNGSAHGVACSSGTTALTLALRALDIGPGDEVIVPEFTMIASAFAVTYNGATPVFVDCADDLDIDVTRIEEAITPRTRAIMPVHVYGRRCDMDAVMALAHDYNLSVVEDSAEAHGVRPVGDIACFSLFGNKIITSGEGGICLTDSPRLAAQMAHLRGMAFDPDHTFLHRKLAFNFRMTNLQAAVALAQTEALDEILERRREIEKRYDAGLEHVPGLTRMPPRDVLWMYDLLHERRDDLRTHLSSAGVETRVFFKPMSRQPMYLDPRWPELTAHRYAETGLYLPTHTGLSTADQDAIIDAVRSFPHEG
ncbi:Lipopolysaccharide biosynthesis protein RffA [Pseudonocardia sp. Ae406_Ps2]|uniref:DegT/DnrJ/EryC1/StrS family aminotransferase n=1 Tax=unclassified Pseudonocardia TaxID=2619320 RepID=UPI00094AB7D6|nr:MULTISPECIES: DegT/DnrJ/EryC1/StrS family aminotransferase [unclassified Pseudonocardia]OLM01476.1 Lipopolysaccharide biosynthesis protein RffA [Pseudonocardia sp. Ae406_Ps2]OLM06726.1 Lipopolysaccharide biosynthesis protein RffA [Pseudonocardia sp. Ae331_Ps2]OLM14978.1 Lipopolysaccharide biosynthesis protein RffA [Pseudonocardia sp. Ae505_Ps2]OLM23042.1 Lipopolysaccharide biosynthesis protein RffA [Pseudonocardia sp. Ae706_Ps2]OLM32113.1 Lipopolysaccharide biosynthesis protein RffA [Pseudo